MKKCLLCHQDIQYQVPLSQLFFGPTPQEPSLCPDCQKRFHPWPQNGCQACGRPCDRKLCNDCQLWQNEYGWVLKNHSLYHYDQAMKDFMRQYKFMGDYRLHQVFQEEITHKIKSLNPTLVVPIPATPHTLMTRGFNQAADLYNGPLCELLGHLQADKQPQSSKGRQARLATPQPFVLASSASLAVERIVLLDDIYTTGRTLYHAAALLCQAGCQDVQSVTLAS